MRKSFMLAAASALALTASGTAFAQGAPGTMGSPYYNTTQTQGSYLGIEGTSRTMTPEEIKNQGPPPPNGGAGTIPPQPYLGALPQSLVGKNIYGLRNDIAGTIVGIRDDKMLVSVGGYLGMGERIVVFPREWATFTGSGDAMVVGTLANKEQISSLPVYAGVVNESPNQTKK